MIKEDQGDGLYEEVYKKILCFFCVLITTFIVFLTGVAIWLGGTSFVILGVGGIVAMVSLTLIIWTPYKAKKYSIPLVIGLLPLLMLLPGKGTNNPDGLLEYRTVFNSWSPLFSGLSEQDLVQMGEKFGYTPRELKSLEGTGGLAKDYEGIEESGLYQQNASVVLDSWFFDRGHYWFYRPAKEKRPLLIFLHGSGGNFKAYQKWFAPYAQKHEIAMAFPTWGFGTWDVKQLGNRIHEVIEDIKKNYSCDNQNIFICGLSQGSLTGIKTLTSASLKYGAFISISGIPYLNDKEFQELSQFKLLFIHGAKDDRVPVSNTRTVYEKLKSKKTNIQYIEFPEEDHTLIKVKTDEVLKAVFDWIGENLN